ncbi:hypothetical protein [Oceanirhabdus sp. W0125-5]|uniref:hypothetical protein n=1 Tax=Oceanirhabdus sp. W0125-5 TaxID=2999116 RepID=UPI0022F33A3A|nr:hypothetical protein [Oceanirhabdus sp. W0125-5]WBW96550.1 hypothetical protein OW730_23080 [Oceanirhabdus sp. W0125-5]
MKKNFKKVLGGLFLSLMVAMVPVANAVAQDDAGEGGGSGHVHNYKKHTIRYNDPDYGYYYVTYYECSCGATK